MRYVSKTYKSRAYWDDEDWIQESPINNITVHEEEKETFTGLYDHEGNPVFRVNDFKMGFI